MTFALVLLLTFVIAGLLGYVTGELIRNGHILNAAIIIVAYLAAGLGLVIYALA